MTTSRTTHAVAAAGFAACLPIELVAFGYAQYRHALLSIGTGHDPWGKLMLIAFLTFGATVFALVLLLVDANDEASRDRRT